jgi:hypothetical protein
MAGGRSAMDQATQRVVGRPGLVSRRQRLRVRGPEHRTAAGLLDGDLDLDEAGDVGDHAVQITALGGDGHELSLSKGLEHPPEATRIAVIAPTAGGHARFARGRTTEARDQFAPDEGDSVGSLGALVPGGMLGPATLTFRPFPSIDPTARPEEWPLEGYTNMDVFRAVFAADLPRSETDVMATAQRPTACRSWASRPVRRPGRRSRPGT